MAIVLLVAFMICNFADEKKQDDTSIPEDSYELKYLGCKLTKEGYSHSHVGCFLFIWKGQKPVKVNAYLTTDKKEFSPFPSFAIHNDSGWHGRSEWCGTGTGWIDVQPGQVISFSMDMGWVENEMVGYPSLVGADKAQFYMSTKDGDLHSDEFPLPLLPTNKK